MSRQSHIQRAESIGNAFYWARINVLQPQAPDSLTLIFMLPDGEFDATDQSDATRNYPKEMPEFLRCLVSLARKKTAFNESSFWIFAVLIRFRWLLVP